MKLSALIADLHNLMESHGDIETVWYGPGTGSAEPDTAMLDLPSGSPGPVLAIVAGERQDLAPGVRFRVDLDVPTHVPPPAHFVFGKILTPAGEHVGRFSAREDIAQALAVRIDGIPREPREWDEDPDEWRDIAANQD